MDAIENFKKRILEILFPKEKNAVTKIILFYIHLFLFLLIFLIFICILLCIINKYFFNSKIAKIDIDGNSISFKSNDKVIYNCLFTTSEFWYNPKIKFEKNEEIIIKATGKYYTAIHHLVEYTKSDTGRLFKWIGPEGINKTELKREVDRIRQKMCIKPDINYGALLARTHKHNSNEVSESYFFDKETNEIRLKFEYDGYLEFIVNEPILGLDEKSKENYLIRHEEDSFYEKKRPIDVQLIAWNKIISEGTTKEIWLDDNIGNFLITIEKKIGD